MEVNTIVCSKLALERCKTYVDQIHAVVFLCQDDNQNLVKTAADNLHRIASLLDNELQETNKMLMLPGNDD